MSGCGSTIWFGFILCERTNTRIMSGGCSTRWYGERTTMAAIRQTGWALICGPD